MGTPLASIKGRTLQNTLYFLKVLAAVGTIAEITAKDRVGKRHRVGAISVWIQVTTGKDGFDENKGRMYHWAKALLDEGMVATSNGKLERAAEVSITPKGKAFLETMKTEIPTGLFRKKNYSTRPRRITVTEAPKNTPMDIAVALLDEVIKRTLESKPVSVAIHPNVDKFNEAERRVKELESKLSMSEKNSLQLMKRLEASETENAQMKATLTGHTTFMENMSHESREKLAQIMRQMPR